MRPRLPPNSWRVMPSGRDPEVKIVGTRVARSGIVLLTNATRRNDAVGQTHAASSALFSDR